MKIIMTALMVFFGAMTASAEGVGVLETLSEPLQQLHASEQSVRKLISHFKADIASKEMSENEDPVVRLAYTDLARTANNLIDHIMDDFDNAPEIIARDTYRAEVELFNEKVESFKTTIAEVYDRHSGNNKEAKHANIVIIQAVLGILVAATVICDWVRKNYHDAVVKKRIMDDLKSLKWAPYEYILTIPYNKA